MTGVETERRTADDTRTTAGAGGDGTTFTAATRLVAEREIKSFLAMKSFWIGLAAIVAGIFAISLLPSIFGGGQPTVAAAGPETAQALEATEFDVRQTADVAAAEDLVRSDEVDAAVVPDTVGDSATGLRVVALEEPPSEIMAALGTMPPVDVLEVADVAQGERQVVILVFSLVFMIFAMGGTAIAQSTVTEKQTRIVEILVSTVPVRALLSGKIAGHTLLTIGQVAVIAVAAPIALQLGGHEQLLEVILPALGWFIPFLCLGFVLLASMWAVTGSLVSRQEDLGSTMGLVMILAIGPYFLVQFFADNPTVMTVLSYVPFSSAIAMPVRTFSGDAMGWEPFVSLAILIATIVLITALATRIYSGSLLQTGGKVALSKAWRQASE